MRQRLDERLHQPDIDHGHLVQNDGIALERIGDRARVDRASAGREPGLEQAVDGLCLHAGEVGQALGRASGRRSEQRMQAERLKHAQDAADRGGLAGARTAG